MNSIDQLVSKDRMKKNRVMAITMGITLFLAVGQALAFKESGTAVLYGFDFLGVIGFYFLFTKFLHKPGWYAYAAIANVFTFAVIGTILFDGGMKSVIITFFLAIFSADAKRQEKEKAWLEQNVSEINVSISGINERIQQNMTSQDNMTVVIEELADGSCSRADQIFKIAQNTVAM